MTDTIIQKMTEALEKFGEELVKKLSGSSNENSSNENSSSQTQQNNNGGNINGN